MKRILAALLALAGMFSCAAAQEMDAPIASYVLPEDAQVFYLPMGEKPQSVETLEPMYELMLNPTMRGDVYVLQMPGGHALASVSCVQVGRSFTAEELLGLWPQIAQEISLDVLLVDGDAECAVVEEIQGIEMLHIQTEITVGEEDSPLKLYAESFAYCRDQSITEIWLVYPQPDAFSGDEQALREDVEALLQFEASLTFPGGEITLINGRPYEDVLGRFVMMVPAQGVVLDSTSDEKTIQEVRNRFAAANPAGADRAFEKLLSYVEDLNSVLIFTEDMQGVLEVSASPMEGLAGMQPEELALMGPALQESMARDYDLALCMADDQRTFISGQDHALMGYWLRTEELDLQLDLMICVCEGWLYEVDVYTVEGNQDMRSTLHAFTSQSLVYTPPVNGLE